MMEQRSTNKSKTPDILCLLDPPRDWCTYPMQPPNRLECMEQPARKARSQPLPAAACAPWSANSALFRWSK